MESLFQNNDGKVDLDEYTETLRKLADNNIEEAINFLFRVYDADGKCCRLVECKYQDQFFVFTLTYGFKVSFFLGQLLLFSKPLLRDFSTNKKFVFTVQLLSNFWHLGNKQ